MQLTNVTVSGFRRLAFYSLELDGKSAIVSGRNGAGKSSLIDAIWLALTGKDAPPIPINKERTKAEIRIEIDFGKYVIVKTWDQSAGAKLEVHIDGEVKASPQKLLADTIGNISFDPFAFVNAAPRDQRSTLLGLAGINLDALEATKRSALDRVNGARKEIVRIKALLDQAPKPAFKPTRIETETILERERAKAAAQVQLVATQAHRNAVTEAKGRQAAEVERLAKALEEAQKKVIGFDEELSATATAISAAEAEVARHPDVTPLLAEAREVNAAADRWERAIAIEADMADAARDLEAAQSALDTAKNDREKALREASWPVEGLTFNGEGVLLDGLPLEESQLSTARIIELGVKVAAALNPTLRICRVRDGSLLDATMLDQVLQTCHSAGMQVLVERVSDGDLSVELVERPGADVAPEPVPVTEPDV